MGDAVRRVGLLRVSASEEEAEHVRRHADALRDDGFPAELVEGDSLPTVIARYAHNGVLTGHDGALHPAGFGRWLATPSRRELGSTRTRLWTFRCRRRPRASWSRRPAA